MSDVDAYRPVVLPSPRLLARMIEDRDRKLARAIDDAGKHFEAAIEDALFDEAIDRRIAEIAA